MGEPAEPNGKGGKIIQFRAAQSEAAEVGNASDNEYVAPDAIYQPGVPIENVPAGFHEAFPVRGALHAYVWWASQVTDAPAWFHAASILAAAAAELSRRGWLFGEEQRYIPRLWMAMVAGPGIGKSTAINLARDFYSEALRINRVETNPYVTAEGSTQGLFEAIARLKNDETKRTTAILIKEEFSTLISGKRRDDLSFALCEWADGHHHERHTRQLQRARAEGTPGGEDRITDAAISATFVTTKHALLEVATAQHLHGGLFSRFLWVPGSGRDVVPRLHPARCADERAVALGAWSRFHGWLDGEHPTVGPKVLPIKAEVNDYLRETLFVDYAQALENDDIMTAHYKRSIGHANIIAGIYALNEGRKAIEPIDMHRAVNFLNLCLDNVSRFAPEVQASGPTRLVNQAFEFILSRDQKGASRAELYRRFQVTKRELDIVLETLKDEDSITEEVFVRTGKPGRPATRYVACGESRQASIDAEEPVE